ncbi:MAG: hypothetical protein ACREEM_00660 [Blastocatellia bacterium]
MIEQHRDEHHPQPTGEGSQNISKGSSYLALIGYRLSKILAPIRNRLPIITNIAIVVVIASALWMYFTRQPTHIKAEIIAEGATFAIGKNTNSNSEAIRIVGELVTQEITVSDFKSINLKPNKLEMINGTPCPIQTKNQSIKIEVSFEDWITRWPFVTLERFQDTKENKRVQHGSLSMRGIEVKQNSTVILKVTNDKETVSLTVQVKDQEISTQVLAGDQFKLIATNCFLTQDDGSRPSSVSAPRCRPKELQNTYKVQLAKGDGSIRIQGQPKSVQYVLTTTRDNKSLFPEGVIPITGIHFNDQGEAGKEVSLIVNGTISYPDHKNITPVELRKAQSLKLRVVEPFQISEITQDKENNLIKFALEGVAEEAKVDHGFINNDLRLSRLRSVWENSLLGQFLLIFVPLVTAALKVREWLIKSRPQNQQV